MVDIWKARSDNRFDRKRRNVCRYIWQRRSSKAHTATAIRIQEKQREYQLSLQDHGLAANFLDRISSTCASAFTLITQHTFQTQGLIIEALQNVSWFSYPCIYFFLFINKEASCNYMQKLTTIEVLRFFFLLHARLFGAATVFRTRCIG